VGQSLHVTFPSEMAEPPHSRRQTALLSRNTRPNHSGRFASIWEPLATPRTIVVYAVVATGSNVAYLMLFRLMQPTLNVFAANVVALVVTTVGNTAAHRRYTFGIRGRARLLVAHVGGLAAMSISLALSTAALAELDALDRQPSILLASTTLWVAAALGAWMRFGPLRTWMGAAAMDP
jgi:putative flippase GtrA